MAKIEIDAPLVDGSEMPFIGEEGQTCKDAVLFICGDDLRPPPRSVVITFETESGKKIVVRIPNDDISFARVSIDGEGV